MNNQELNNLKQAEEATLVTSNSLDGTSALADPNDPVEPTKVGRTTRITENPSIEINPFLLVGLIFGIIVIWLAIASIKDLFRTNPYGNQIQIDNFNQFFKDMSNTDRDGIYNTLYNTVKSNTTEDITIPQKGAEIRVGSANTEYDDNTDTYTSTFLVDIPELQQTYSFWVYWSTDPSNFYVTTAGYGIITYCPTEEQLIYPAFPCSDMQNSQGVTTDPIMRLVPISVNYYTDNYAKYIYYTITARISDDNENLTIIITSYSGDVDDNYKAAIKKLQDSGIDTSKYTVEYVDSSDYSAIPAKP